MHLWNKNRGSITVEASIVVPIIILSIAAIIYCGFFLCEKSILQAVADKSVKSAASTWDNIDCDIWTGKTSLESQNNDALYWRIFDDKQEEKVERARKYIDRLLKNVHILKPRSTEINVELRDFVIYKRLELKACQFYKLPFGSILKLFGHSGSFEICVTSYAVLDEPQELIRNVDFVFDLERDIEESHDGVKNFGDKVRGILLKVKEGIAGFGEKNDEK